MVLFLKNWVQGIAIAVIIVSIFEMLIPNGNLKKYIKVVLGLYIVFSIIAPFVDTKKLYSFDVSKEIEKYDSSQVHSTNDIKNNIQEIYLNVFEDKIKSIVKNQGYNVRSCLVDAVFEGNENELGIKKISIVLSSKNSNYFKKDEEDIDEVEEVNKININIDISKENEKVVYDEITTDDIEDLRNFLADYLEVKKKIIFIESY